MFLRLSLRCLCLCFGLMATALSAQTGQLQREDVQGFARISILFDEMPGARLDAKGSVVRIVFDRPVKLLPDRLASLVPTYVSAARLDPDQRTMRLALTGLHKVQLIPLADRFLLDVLPETWVGLPPPPPQDMLDALAARLRAAEDAVKAKGREPPLLSFEAVRLSDSSMKFLFALGPAVPARFDRQGDRVNLSLGAPFKLDLPAMRAAAPFSVLDIRGETTAKDTHLVFVLAPQEGVTAQREPEGYSLEIGRVVRPARQALHQRRPADFDDRLADAAAMPFSLQTKRIQSVRGNERLRIDFPFAIDKPVAAYHLGSHLYFILGVALPETPDLSAIGDGIKARVEIDRAQDITIFSLTLPRPEPVRLLQRDGQWSLTLGALGSVSTRLLALRRDADGQALFDLAASRFVYHTDPETGVRRLIALAQGPVLPSLTRYEYPQFAIEAAAHGLVITPFGEGLSLDRDGATRVVLQRKGGLLLSHPHRQDANLFDAGAKPVIDLARWERDAGQAGLGALRVRLDQASATSGLKRALARIDLARLYAAQGLYIESLGPFRIALEDEPSLRGESDLLLEQAIYAAMARRCDVAETLLSLPSLRGRGQTLLWSAYCAATRNQNVVALMHYRAALSVLPHHPLPLRWALSLSLIDVALIEREYELAQRIVNDLSALSLEPHEAAQLEWRRARIAEELGDMTRAMAHYEPLLHVADPLISVAARVAQAELVLRSGLGPVEEARAEIERIAVSWHGDTIAARALTTMARHYASQGDWRSAFIAARRALERYADDHAIGALEEDMKTRFEDVMASDKAGLSPAQLVALFFDFREFAPSGERGDDLVLRLVHRLIALDLLDEAAQLLRFQIDYRLHGVARAAAAETLGSVEIARNDPQAALRILDETRFSDMPDDLARRRLLLQAKALSATLRPHVALDLISEETGPDIVALRADIAWENGLWLLAGETLEAALGDVWRQDAPLSDGERANVLRASLAYLRAQDELSLDRLRTKFLSKMSASPDAQTFAGLSSAGRLSPLLRTQTPIDAQMMQGFLNEMRKRSAAMKPAG